MIKGFSLLKHIWHGISSGVVCMMNEDNFKSFEHCLLIFVVIYC